MKYSSYTFSQFILMMLLLLFMSGQITGAVLPPTNQVSSPSATVITWLNNTLAVALDTLKSSLANPTTSIDSRDLASGALTAMELTQDAPTATALITKLFSVQNTTTGDIPWVYQGTQHTDANSIEFCMSWAAPLFIKYNNNFTPAFKADALPHLILAAKAVKNHGVDIAYTNIYLTKAVNLILLGQIIGDPATTALGDTQLKAWLTNAKANGIAEYSSTTYYGVDINALSLGYLFTNNATAKADLLAALTIFWTDITGNYFAGSGYLSGPQSRTYTFRTQEGTIDAWTYGLGIRETVPNIKNFDLVGVLVNLSGGYWPTHLIPVALRSEKVVTQKWTQAWRTPAGKDRYNYISKNFSIGSAGSDYSYGPTDKDIVIQFATSLAMPDISVIADDKAAIYGVEWGALRAGHLDTLQSVVQNKGKILTLLNVKPDSRYSRTELSTNILLPYKNNEVLVNGVVITNLASGASTVIKVGDTVSVRKGTTVASVRIISSQSCAGSILNMVLRVDDPTKQEARLALFHYQNPSVAPPLNCSARSVLLFEANDIGNIADIRAATVTQSTENNILDVSATWGGTVLRVQKNLINDDVINRRYGNALQAFSVLNVE